MPEIGRDPDGSAEQQVPNDRLDGVPTPASPAGAVEIALAAYDHLAELAESVEEEWSYVTALADHGRTRLRATAASGPDVPVARLHAVAVAAAEISAITDPHRAIDWLSTFPAIVELALLPQPAAG